MTEQDVLEKQGTDSAKQARAVGLFLLKRYDDAISVYDELLEDDPENMILWVNKMLCSAQTDFPDTLFIDVMLSNEQFLPAQGDLLLAETFFQMQGNDEALLFVNRVLEKDPDNIDACVLKAKILDKIDASNELFAFMKSIYPRLMKDERVLCLMAFFAVTFWNTRQADYLLKKALKINRNAVLQNDFFYTCLAATDKEDDVVVCAAEALNDRKDNPVIWMALANAYVVLEQYDMANDAFDMLSRLSALSDDMKMEWANVLSKQKEFDRAFDLLSQMKATSDSLFLPIRSNLLAMYEAGLWDKAKEKAFFWRSENPDNPDIGYTVAAILKESWMQPAPRSFVKLICDVDTFDMAERSFKENCYFGTSLLDETLQVLKLPVARSLHVLDAGCGAGAASKILRDFTRPDGVLDGVDISRAALELSDNLGGYDRLEEADLLDFFRSCTEKYDLIVCLDSLYYFPDLTNVFEAAKKALKPNGFLVFTVLAEKTDKVYSLTVDGKFKHNSLYVSNCLKKAALSQKYQTEGILYKDTDDKKDREDINCYIFAARKENNVNQ